MASSSKSNTKCLSPRFYDYLNGLREEFEVQSKPTLAKKSRPRRFNVYLEGVKCEFELMAEDIESLQKERDELEIKVEAQAMELRNVSNVVCRVCSKSPARNIASPPLKALECAPSSAVQSNYLQKLNSSSPVKPPASTSRNIGSAPWKTSGKASSSSSTLYFQPKTLPKPNTYSRVIKPSQKTFRLSTRHMTITRKSHTAITPTRPSQSVSDTTSRCSDPIVAYSQRVTAPSPLPQISASTVNADSGPEERLSSTNDVVGKDLRIHTVHTLTHEKLIWSVKFSQNGKYLAAGCRDGKAYVYDVQTGTLIRVLGTLLADDDLAGAVCFSRDGKYLATGSNHKGIYIWEINTRYVRNALNGKILSVRSLDFSPDDRLLVSASEKHTVWLWNMRDGAVKGLTDGNSQFTAYYTSAVFSPDGGHVAASSSDGMVRIWHVPTGRLMKRVKAHANFAYDAGFTPDGRGLVSVGGTLKYWDISSWTLSHIRARPQPSHLDDCISASEEQTRPDREYSNHSGSVCCLAISPDGRWVASGSWDNTARIWDTRSRVVQRSLDHKGWVYSVDFSPAGHYLAFGGMDRSVTIWRYTPGE